MILYGLVDGDPYTRKVRYQARTCFLMTQLGEPIPEEVDTIRRDLRHILEAHDIKLIDANSDITGKDFLSKVWSMIVAVPLAVAIVHKEMRVNTLHNVFYEIGVAQALGKETIVVKARDAEVPSDFVRTEYIEYDETFQIKMNKFLKSFFDRADYYEDVASLLEQNPLLAIDYLRRAYLISGRKDCRKQARNILESLTLEGRARDSVEMMLAEF